MIDLHTHTTASDGQLSPEALVAEAASRGVGTLAVTDHDTVAAMPAAANAARRAGVRLVPGLEITAVHAGRDVHVLGYFVDVLHAGLLAFLERQREDRRRRLRDIVSRLDALGLEVDAAPLLEPGERGGRAVGRPMVAAALVAAGHARDISEAFSRFLVEGRPAFVERVGAPPADVVALIARAGGLSSLAHPGKTGVDALLGDLASSGLTAIEVYHPDHDASAVSRYQQLAVRHDLLTTGGSDYHGPNAGRVASLGRISLPAADFARLEARAGRPATGRA